MYCTKCGKEIKEENKICTNCEKLVNENELNNVNLKTEKSINKDKISNMVINKKVITKITFMILILIIFILLFLLLKDNEKLNNLIQKYTIGTNAQAELTSKIEIGVTYRADEVNFIRFDTEKEFTMEIGEPRSEKFTMTGDYTINDNIITLNITYDSYYLGYTEEPSTVDFEPYKMTAKILDNGNLECEALIYVKSEENTNIPKDNMNSNNLSNVSILDEIYNKYPEYKDKEGFICSDEKDYWLLDVNGEKIYFDDVTSFEYALNAVEFSLNSGIEFDINRFIEELSYGALWTVNDSNYGGDGYRSDDHFYNEGLTIDDFSLEETDIKKYTLNTNGNTNYNYSFLLTIQLSKENKLQEISIETPVENVNGILSCAKEVEDALGYLLINSRNFEIVNTVKKNLMSQGAISDNGAILKKDAYTQVYDEKESKTSSLTISESNIKYRMAF